MGKKGPRIHMTESEWNFGTIKTGEVVKKIFSVENTGSEQLLIEGVVEECSCISASMNNKKIDPGAKGELSVMYDSQDNSGKVDSVIQLMTNDIKTPIKIVKIKGNILE